MIERLVYVSRAQADVGPHTVYDIIRSAHNRNSRFGLTGGLVFVDGHFVQVLEGEGHRLRERFARIAADPRHSHVELRHAGPVQARAFPDDWMALRLSDQIDAEVLARHGYCAGLPTSAFDGERLLAFVRDCCAAVRV